MNQSQLITVRRQLKQAGQVSRNWALQRYISRLGAIIFVLKNQGWGFTEEYVPTIKPDGTKGRDFVYKVKWRPEE